MKTYAKRIDANHNEIVELFRALGCLVYDASKIGGGFPDIIVQRTRPQDGFVETLLVEIKDKRLIPSRRKLNDRQVLFHSIWTCHVVECADDVFKLLGINRN